MTSSQIKVNQSKLTGKPDSQSLRKMYMLSNNCYSQRRTPVLKRNQLSRRQAKFCVRSQLQNGNSKENSLSVVLLAGGVGKRMGAKIPKQYLPLLDRPIATYSLETFAFMDEVSEIVVVCDPSWRDIFQKAQTEYLNNKIQLIYAEPGAERQDSVFNGLSKVSSSSEFVAIHDSARPLVTQEDVRNCFKDAKEFGAAVLGVKVKPTIKEVKDDLLVERTLVRSKLWEVQTPQIIKVTTLQQGFEKVKAENLEVTDDVSIIEGMGLPVKITPGSYTNIKITTPDDMPIAEGFVEELQIGKQHQKV
eukprot:TRINITY_DN24034_c0_g1_i1.p1 TRINITY_DN24034_c0_g1~~TRINITY_DN24034_c0_g1_i1.p1  ORF type:complete len:304 (-),score=27.39 TRINITY_DN24034_c0_g1_i1:478-1389(-)